MPRFINWIYWQYMKLIRTSHTAVRPGAQVLLTPDLRMKGKQYLPVLQLKDNLLHSANRTRSTNARQSQSGVNRLPEGKSGFYGHCARDQPKPPVQNWNSSTLRAGSGTEPVRLSICVAWSKLALDKPQRRVLWTLWFGKSKELFFGQVNK